MMRTIVVVLAVFFISSTSAFAMSDRVGKMDAGFQIGGLLATDDNVDAGAYYGATFSYGIYPWFAIGVEGGCEDSKTNFSAGSTTYEAGLSRIPLFFDLIFRYGKPENDFVPYSVLGLGGVFTSVHGAGTLNTDNKKLEADSSFAAKFGLGLDWKVSDHWMLNVEGSYVWAAEDAEIKDRTSFALVDSANLDYWTITGGAKYLFD